QRIALHLRVPAQPGRRVRQREPRNRRGLRRRQPGQRRRLQRELRCGVGSPASSSRRGSAPARLGRVSRRPRLTIPRRVFLGFALMLPVRVMVSMASSIEPQRPAVTVSLVHEGYLPLSLTLSEARATQSVFGNLLDRVLSERDSSATRLWLSAAR